MAKFSTKTVISIVLVAIVAVYLYGLFTETTLCTADDLDDPSTADVDESEHGCEAVGDKYLAVEIPPEGELKSSTLWIVKILLIGGAVYIGTSLVMKYTGGRIGKKDILTMIMIGIAVYVLWTYILSDVFNAVSFDDLAKVTAKKIGLG